MKRTAITLLVLGVCVFLLSQCIDQQEKKPPAATTTVSAAGFAGSETCAGCHKDIFEDQIHTAHYLTTRPPLEKYFKGSFDPGQNTFVYDPSHTVAMEKRDSGFYEVGYKDGVEKIARRIDIIVGSASKGQTYITRFGKILFQLPVSYFTAAHKWANSPLYPIAPVIFDRPITSRCLECHTTYAQVLSPPGVEPERFGENIIYGVDCEKCHGPAARHVDFHSTHPGEKRGQFILEPATFTRQQRLDLCGLCHSGRLDKTAPSFTFTAGKRLADYFRIDTAAPPPDPEKIDVHGNQYGLLRASKCFRMSPTMTCLTCHNPHKNERGDIALFSQRCMSCHNGTNMHLCKLTASLGPSIEKNCIDCHMPRKASVSITELLPGDKVPTAAMIRSHYIAIYAKKK